MYGPSGELVRVDIDEERAGVVREIADRVLAGETIRSITGDLADRRAAIVGSAFSLRRVLHVDPASALGS